MKRTYYRDKWNHRKVWEVTELSHGIYLRQYINMWQFGRGVRTNKKKLAEIGIAEMEVIKNGETSLGIHGDGKNTR